MNTPFSSNKQNLFSLSHHSVLFFLLITLSLNFEKPVLVISCQAVSEQSIYEGWVFIEAQRYIIPHPILVLRNPKPTLILNTALNFEAVYLYSHVFSKLFKNNVIRLIATSSLTDNLQLLLHCWDVAAFFSFYRGKCSSELVYSIMSPRRYI